MDVPVRRDTVPALVQLAAAVVAAGEAAARGAAGDTVHQAGSDPPARQAVPQAVQAAVAQADPAVVVTDGRAHAAVLRLVSDTLVHEQTMQRTVSALALFPDGRRALVGLNSGAILTWDLVRRRLLARCHGHVRRLVQAIAAIDNTSYVSGSSDRTIRVWRQVSICGLVPYTQCDGVLKAHASEITSLDVLEDRQHIVSGSRLFVTNDACSDSRVGLWRRPDPASLARFVPREYQPIRRAHGHVGMVTHVVALPFRQNLEYVSACTGKHIIHWSANQDAPLRRYITQDSGYGLHIHPISFDIIGVGTRSGDVLLYNLYRDGEFGRVAAAAGGSAEAADPVIWLGGLSDGSVAVLHTPDSTNFDAASTPGSLFVYHVGPFYWTLTRRLEGISEPVLPVPPLLQNP